MTDQTRRNILRYGIAVDLVILATGVGMLAPTPTAPLLIVTYAIAVALSVWRGGWKGGLTALVLSLVALIAAFPEINTATNIAAFIALGAIGGTIVALITRPSVGSPVMTPQAEMLAPFTGGPIAVPQEGGAIARPDQAEEAADDFARKPLERSALAEVEPLAEPLVQARTNADTQDNRKRNRGKKRGGGVSEKRVVLPEPPAAVVDQAALREAERVRQQELAEAERVRLQQELEARLAVERENAAREIREAAQRELEERLAAERRAIEEEAARQRADAERRAAEAEAERARAEAERHAIEEETARQRADAERRAAEAERARAESERRAIEEETTRQRAEAEQHAAAAEAERERIAAERRAIEEEATRQRLETERRAAEVEAERTRAEEERQRAADARQLAETERQRVEAERARLAEELEARLAQEREAAQKELIERLEGERRTAEEDLRRQFEAERQALRATAEQELAAERERLSRSAEERIAAAHQAAEAVASGIPKPAPPPPPPPARKNSLLDTVSGWFRSERAPTSHVNLKTKRVSTNTNTTAKRPVTTGTAPAKRTTAAVPVVTGASKPRVLLIERRRGTADTIAPKLRHRGVEIEVVERWVDAVDEIFRFKPHALFLDIEHPEFDRMHRTITEKTTQLPIILTGRAGSTPPEVRRAAFVGRPYDLEEVTRVAQLAATRLQDLLAEQSIPRALLRPAGLTMVPPPSLRGQASAPKKVAAPAVEVSPSVKPATNEEYEITCYSCRAPFNAVDADWCSCLAKERTMVCTNCLSCFCKAPPSYKETFWIEAPPRLFERKTAEARKQGASLPPNPSRAEVTRPLVLTVEDDEEIQAIVQRVCANLGYGFIWATNGQDGLDLAHEYRPEMILSDAFMPKLDGREMCRMLKEEPEYADTRMVIMTGLYTDTKYRSEAVKRFHVDDYVAKPVSITDLINLLQKHLEGVVGLPLQEDLHELHRQQVVAGEGEPEITAPDGIPLADILMQGSDMIPVSRPRDSYEVCCFNCQQNFEATRAEWCSCVGRDNTLICEHCHGCFCKAPAAYRERFWIDAPPSLFERKMIGSKRNLSARSNPAPTDVKRPLILLVEDDENVQLIVRTVVSNMGYGFVVGANGQEGLTLAREYDPDLILSDAFMPKLDGREMCRLLKEDPNTARSKAVIMTGLYTDRKYRNEALDYFKVDDYVAKPLAVDDLIKLFKKHLPQEVTTAH